MQTFLICSTEVCSYASGKEPAISRLNAVARTYLENDIIVSMEFIKNSYAINGSVRAMIVETMKRLNTVA